ncbi:MAG: single-stranded DNA-binding protein [Candidatus Dormibacteria bacterium]
MAGSLNRVQLIGRLTADPEMKYLPTGAPVTQLRMATNRYSTSQDGERKEFTDYHDVVVWNIGGRKLAELAGQYLKKGSLVYIEGRLQTRSWEGQDGQKRYRTEVNCNDIQFLESKGGADGTAAPEDVRAATRQASPSASQAFASGLKGGAPSPSNGRVAAGVGAAVDPKAQRDDSADDIDPDDIPF